jgi:hypothetical protein
VHARVLGWALEAARSAEAAAVDPERTRWSGWLAADQASIRAALSWALGGHEPEAGRELAALPAAIAVWRGLIRYRRSVPRRGGR